MHGKTRRYFHSETNCTGIFGVSFIETVCTGRLGVIFTVRQFTRVDLALLHNKTICTGRLGAIFTVRQFTRIDLALLHSKTICTGRVGVIFTVREITRTQVDLELVSQRHNLHCGVDWRETAYAE